MVGVEVSVAAVPGRVDAVEEVDSPFNAFQDVGGSSHAHEVGFVHGEVRAQFRRARGTFLRGFLQRPGRLLRSHPGSVQKSFWRVRFGYPCKVAPLVDAERSWFLLMVSSWELSLAISALQRSSQRVVRATEFST